MSYELSNSETKKLQVKISMLIEKPCREMDRQSDKDLDKLLER